MAQLGHLESFHLSSSCDYNPAAVDVGKALVHAVDVNKNLKVLEISGCHNVWDSCWKDLFGILEKHKGLQSLCIDYYPTEVDPCFSWLKQLLVRNRRFDVTVRDSRTSQTDSEIDRIDELNVFLRGSDRLKTEAPSTRLSLFGATLTERTTCDIQLIGLLLMDHTDVLCELLHERMYEVETEAEIIETYEEGGVLSASIAPAAGAEGDRGVKRQRGDS